MGAHSTTDEVLPVVVNEQVVDVIKQQKNHATELIEDFMVAANGVVARKLEGVSSLRRIVRTPERWDRIVQLAAANHEKLPAQPDSKALNDLLIRRKAADPDHFAEVSLAVIKLIGPGEYVLERAGEPAPGHFGLAVQDYTHSTAPNRRFPTWLRSGCSRPRWMASRIPTPTPNLRPSPPTVLKKKMPRGKLNAKCQSDWLPWPCRSVSAKFSMPWSAE